MKTWTRLVFITLLTCYALVLVGSIVRATGSGLGCPDWPRCFGRWVPPFHISELPGNYREIFAVQGKRIAPFSAFKTWTEYLNRLLGVVVGLQVLGVLLGAWRWARPPLRGLSLMVFLLVGFQGWLGSQVVSSHLSSTLVTVHMFVAVVVVLMLVELYLGSQHLLGRYPHALLQRSYGWLLIMALIQLVLGTQGRAQIDRYLHGEMTAPPRAQWYESLGGIFTVHHWWAYGLVLALAYHGCRRYRDLRVDAWSKTWGLWVVITLSAQMFSGMAFKYLNFAAPNQPVHLLLAVILISLLYGGIRLHRTP